MANKHVQKAVSVAKKPKESSEKLVQRFQKTYKASRTDAEVKEKQYFSKPKKKRIVRAAALKREFYRSKREKEKYY